MFRSYAIFVFLPLIFYLPVAYADDIDDGKNIFLWNCHSCHAFACNKYGPRLGGLFGRKAGTVEDYEHYTQGLKDSEIVWTETTLDEFFSDPGKRFPKSTMAFAGRIADAVRRQKLIAYLKTEDSTVDRCPRR